MFATDARDRRIARMSDRDLLTAILKEDLSPGTRKAFSEMLAWIDQGEGRGLSKRQREWVEDALREETPIEAVDVPRGREVETPDVLKNLPKKPPHRSGEP